MEANEVSEQFEQQSVVDSTKVTEEILVNKSPEPSSVQTTDGLTINTELQQNGGAGSGKSSPPSSPRSVEGFVTSVELNTAQEQLAAATTAFSAASPDVPLEQSSGPFSVYVSSSPEPTSLDPLANVGETDKASPMTLEHTTRDEDSVQSSSPVSMEVESPHPPPESPAGVEIVHAQSMVEVVAPPSPTQDFAESVPAEVTVVSSESSAVYSSAPMTDLMSTSMILEQPISDAPEQVEQMMQFMASSAEVYNVEQQQSAEMVNIDRQLSPEIESANLLDASPVSEGPLQSDVASPSPVPISPVQEDHLIQPEFVSSPLEDQAPSPVIDSAPSPVESASSPVVESAPSPIAESAPSPIAESAPSPIAESAPSPIAESAPSPIAESVPSPVVESEQSSVDDLVEKMNQVNIHASQAADETEIVASDVPATPTRSESRTPVSDVTPATPVAEPTIEGRPVSPIHTPTTAGHVPHSEVVSEIVPPVVEKKKAPVKPAPRSTLTARTSAAKTGAPPKATPTPSSTSQKPGTPRPTARSGPAARTTPGTAVRSSATTRTTPSTTTSRTPGTRTTPASRPSSTSSTRTTTTTRTATGRTTTPSATRTTPSTSASRPTPTSRTTRTPLSSTTKSTTPSSRPSSRPASTTSTPTTTRRVPISRRPATAGASTKDSTEKTAPAKPAASSTDNKTATRAPLTRKPLYPGPSKTATTSKTDKKEIKNSTNKMLSSRTTTTTRTSAARTATSTAPTHRTTATRTTGQ